MKQSTIALISGFFMIHLLAGSALAQRINSPVSLAGQDNLDLGAALSFSEVEYEVESASTDIERNILGLSAAYGLSSNVDMFADLGFALESELDDVSGDGDGFFLAFGVKGLVYQQSDLRIFTGARLQWINEDYGSGADGELLEVGLDGTAAFRLVDNLDAYLGIEIFPYTDGELKWRNRDADLERDNIVGMHLGAQYDFPENWYLRADFALISEEAFTLGGGVRF